MSDVKHSPLPWKIDQTYSAHCVSIVGSDGRLVAGSSWHEDSPYYPTQAQTYANFYLIASAVNSAAAKDARIAELEADNARLRKALEGMLHMAPGQLSEINAACAALATKGGVSNG